MTLSSKADFEALIGRIGTDFRGVEAELKAHVERTPDSFLGHLYLAYLYNYQRRYAAAIEALEQAARLDPSAYLVRFNLGYCRHQCGRVEEALGDYLHADRLANGRWTDAPLQAAACEHQLGRPREAITRYRDILRRTPDSPVARYGLARALADDGGVAEAASVSGALSEDLKGDAAAVTAFVAYCNRYDFHGYRELDDKATLAKRVAEFRGVGGAEAFPYLPPTFVMPAEYPSLQKAQSAGNLWIIKPATLFGGQDVRLTDDPGTVPREDGWIGQRYIHPPLLVDGRKSHIRLYLLIADAGQQFLFLYHDGIVRLAPEAYRVEGGALGDIARHVTNTARFAAHPEVRCGQVELVRTLGAVLDHPHESGHDAGALRSRLRGLAAAVANLVVQAGVLERQTGGVMRYAYPPKLLGLDVLLDAAGQPWLLEIESYPALGGTAEAVRAVHIALFADVASCVLRDLSGRDEPAPATNDDAARRWYSLVIDDD